jgi:hypothetical protein
MEMIKSLRVVPTLTKMRETYASICLIGCKPEEEDHTPECRERQAVLRSVLDIMRELLDEVRIAQGDGEGVLDVRKRLNL